MKAGKEPMRTFGDLLQFYRQQPAASADGDGWRVSVTAARFAYGVRLSLDGMGARFSDNFFHLLPGDTVTVRVTPEAPVPDLPARLRLRSLWPG